MSFRDEVRDPWVASGLALLAILSMLAVLLYGKAPQSVEEARARVWSTALPDAFAPRLAQARERLRSAQSASQAGRDSAALLAYGEAEQHASAAWELADGPDQQATALALWAEARLASAELLLRLGTGAGLRPDDNDLLREALQRAEQLLQAPLAREQRARAEALRERIARQLRPGPLEWIPPWRR